MRQCAPLTTMPAMSEAPDPTLTKSITIRVPEVLYRDVQRFARADHRKVADWCRLRLTEAVVKRLMDEKHPPKRA